MTTSASKFEIENIPVSATKGRKLLYPFQDMEVGQSFFVVADDEKKVRAACRQYGKRHGVNFSLVKDGGGFRCGRTA